MSEHKNPKTTKFQGPHARPCQANLKSGQTVSVDLLAMKCTFLGLINGIPWDSDVEKRVEKAKEFVRQNWYGPEPLVISPDVLDPESRSPIRPSLTLMAQHACSDSLNIDEHGSWLNLIWSAVHVKQMAVENIVIEAADEDDWNRQATGFFL